MLVPCLWAVKLRGNLRSNLLMGMIGDADDHLAAPPCPESSGGDVGEIVDEVTVEGYCAAWVAVIPNSLVRR